MELNGLREIGVCSSWAEYLLLPVGVLDDARAYLWAMQIRAASDG